MKKESKDFSEEELELIVEALEKSDSEIPEENRGLLKNRVSILESEVVTLKNKLEELIMEAKTFFELVEKKKKC